MKNRLMLAAIALLASSGVMAQSTTNSIYIEQVGDGSIIDLTQKGQGNKIGTEQNRIILEGNNQTVTVTQEGNNNSIQGAIVQADNINTDVTITGDSNTLTYDQGDSASVATSTQTLTVTGDSNELTFNQGTAASATGATQTIEITGDTNTLTSTINADDVVNTKTIAGDNNTITTLQEGTAGKNIEMLLTGNTNTVEIKQSSTTNVDTLKINSTSNGSTITINQCNAGGPC
jgi:hypothetical protein